MNNNKKEVTKWKTYQKRIGLNTNLKIILYDYDKLLKNYQFYDNHLIKYKHKIDETLTT